MSESGRKNLAYPRSQVETRRFFILRFCGGMGGGGCAVPLNASQFVYPIRVSKHIVYNRSLLLENPENGGVNIYTNAGSNGFCNETFGARRSWWLAFSDNGVLTPDEIMQRGIEIATESPHLIEVQANKLPQPVLPNGGANPNWQNRIYVHIYWGNSSYVADAVMRDDILNVVKHNYDIKL